MWESLNSFVPSPEKEVMVRDALGLGMGWLGPEAWLGWPLAG